MPLLSCLFINLLACFMPQTFTDTINNALMRAEADAFLQQLPPGLQQKQADAVRRATKGNLSPLEKVRNARNTAPSYSENVRVTELSPSLRFYEPKGAQQPLPLLIYLHGGGWAFGSLNSCARFCNAIAKSGKVKVLAVNYPLAPEHPYPAGLDSCVAALLFAHEHADSMGVDKNHISVGGDSSGGNLAIATALSDRSKTLIHSLVLFYPVTLAYNDHSPSWNTYGKGFGLDADLMEAFNAAYTTQKAASHPFISVALNENAPSLLPRTLLIAAGRDILCDQGRTFAEVMGSKLTRIEYAEAVHLFITVPGQNCAFNTAVKQTLHFLFSE